MVCMLSLPTGETVGRGSGKVTPLLNTVQLGIGGRNSEKMVDILLFKIMISLKYV